MSEQWEYLENWLATSGTVAFASWELAGLAGISSQEATDWIQSYQRAQKLQKTRYVISRQGRTSGTVWHVGATTKALERVKVQFVDDVLHRVHGHLGPTVDVISVVNPKAVVRANEIMFKVGGLVQELQHLAG